MCFGLKVGPWDVVVFTAIEAWRIQRFEQEPPAVQTNSYDVNWRYGWQEIP